MPCVQYRDQSPRLPRDSRRLAQRKVHGGGMVLDWGVHMLDQIMMMIQKPLRSVYAIMSHVTNDDVDDGFKIFLDFEAGSTSRSR